MYMFSFIKEKKICCSTKLSPIVILSTRMCLVSSIINVCVCKRCQLLFECEMMRLPWVEAFVRTASSSSICWQYTARLLLPIVFVVPHVSLPGWFWSRSSPFLPPSPREQCVCLCVYVCARARFLLFVDSVLSNSYRMKGSNTRTRCRHCRFFFSLLFLSIRHRAYPKTPQECFLSNVRTCFILSPKTKISSMYIIWCLNEIRLSSIYA
jgi:hypothetical protein